MMTVFEDIELMIDADAVLRGQGADPAVMRERRPALVKLAEQAIEEGLPLVEPRVDWRTLQVREVRHERVLLEGGGQLSGKLVVQHLAQAEQVHVLVCSIGDSLERYSQEVWSSSAVYSLALDGAGSAAVEALANAACRHLEEQAAERGWKCSIPLSPGMLDWPVEQGQPQIFALMEGESLGVSLTPSFLMMPRKALTMVVGAGPQLEMAGKTCDYCSLKDVCRYQDHYARE
jgi:hypothetical protein